MDALDKALVAGLSEDGRRPVQQLGEEAGVTGPTVRARLQNLQKSGVFKVAGLVDPARVEEIVICLIGIRLEKFNLAEKLNEIAMLRGVSWAAVVAGRYDVMAEVISHQGNEGISRFVVEELGRVEGILSTETFIVMRPQNKWVLPPPGMVEDWRGGGK